MIQDEHLNHHGRCAVPISSNHLWGCIREAEAQLGMIASASSTAEVDDGPAVFPREPHHVAGLEVAVHQA
jgi:hypothetical protein